MDLSVSISGKLASHCEMSMHILSPLTVEILGFHFFRKNSVLYI